ncbi:MAG: MoaD/ThiS family protein [Bdellovibrionales bacterium]|nr:MoaD/ThiS family protein [Bdellovibrionales bacterium]
MIQVKVELYGAFRNCGWTEREVDISLSGPVTVAELRRAFAERLGELAPGFSFERLLGDSAFANDTRLLEPNDRIEASCRLAILPPVCGG